MQMSCGADGFAYPCWFHDDILSVSLVTRLFTSWDDARTGSRALQGQFNKGNIVIFHVVSQNHWAKWGSK